MAVRNCKVVIFGYYGRGNLGDETNLRCLIQMLRGLGLNNSIIVISADPARTSAQYQVPAIGKYAMFQMVRTFGKADLLVGGGGTLFQDQTSQRSLFYYCSLIWLAKWFRMKTFLYGQGIGPIRSTSGRWIARSTLNRIDLITVRDNLSLITLGELGVKRPEMYCTAEPLLATPVVTEPIVRDYWRKYPTVKPYQIGLILRGRQAVSIADWLRLLATLQQDSRVELYLLTTDEADLPLVRELAARSGITVLPTLAGWEQLLAAVSGLSLVVSSRLHGLVAAVIQGTSCYGVAVDPKIEGFCLQLCMPFHSLIGSMDWTKLAYKILLELNRVITDPGDSKLPFWRVRALENQLLLQRMIEPIQNAYSNRGNTC